MLSQLCETIMRELKYAGRRLKTRKTVLFIVLDGRATV